MKKFVALVLVAVMALALCACGQSAEMKAYKAAVKALPSEINYDSWDAIKAANDAYAALSEDEKKSADTTAFDAAVDSFKQLTAFQACKYVKDSMKDPSSFRLYDEVIWSDFTKVEPPDASHVICLRGDAKNSWGAYAGAHRYEVLYSDTNGIVGYIYDESADYMDFYGKIYVGSTPELEAERAEGGIVYFAIPGEAAAFAIGCEYVD